MKLITTGVQPKILPSSTSSSSSSSSSSTSSALAVETGSVVPPEFKHLHGALFVAGRNRAPKFKTTSREVATHICRDCQSFLNEEDADEGCCEGQDGVLGIYNSPRFGICGYEG